MPIIQNKMDTAKQYMSRKLEPLDWQPIDVWESRDYDSSPIYQLSYHEYICIE